MWFSFLILSVTLSIDAFGIGIAYAVKSIGIPIKAKLMIGMLSAGILWLSALTGELMARFLPEWCIKYLGVLIICIIGIIFIRNSLKNNTGSTYDFDSSKKIEGIETIFLAVALSADSISVGMAAAALGYSWFILGLLVGIVQILFLFAGEAAVRKNSRLSKSNGGKSGIISGILLIIIGIMRLCL